MDENLSKPAEPDVEQGRTLPKKVFKDFLMEIGTANVWSAVMSGSIATGI